MPRLLLLVLLSCLVAGCGSLWSGTASTLKGALFSPEYPPITRKEVYQRPYFQMMAQTDNAQALFILTRVSGAFRYWQTGSQESLILSGGLIFRTTGLSDNLEQTRFIGDNPFATGLHKISENTVATREIDLSNYRYGIRVDSTFHLRGKETVTVLERQRNLLHVEEVISAPAIKLFATNHYWVDDKGFIWQSRQTLWPDYTITITQLRPYKEEAL